MWAQARGAKKQTFIFKMKCKMKITMDFFEIKRKMI